MLSTNYQYTSAVELKNFRIRIKLHLVHFSIYENVLWISIHRLGWITVL